VECKELKFRTIYRFKDKYPVNLMCCYFEVSRSGYYAWTKRLDREDLDEPVANLIRECQQKTKQTYGYRRITLWLLREANLKINHKAVLRIMNKYGLLSQIRRRRKYVQYCQHLHRYENILNRDFNAGSPNQKWVTDISYIHTKQGVLYLSVIKDLYDNSIIAHKTGTEQSINLVTDTIKMAKTKEKVTTELHLHSDQGFQYTSHAYFNLTKEYGITPSMSRRGNCLDNACVENFFGTLKSECIYRAKPETLSEARELIDEYIYFYNNDRIQLKTKMTPFEKRRHLA
jgi:transposase InsO family protein